MESLLPGEGHNMWIKRREVTECQVYKDESQRANKWNGEFWSFLCENAASVWLHFWGLACCGYWASVFVEVIQYPAPRQYTLKFFKSDFGHHISVLCVNPSNYQMLIRNADHFNNVNWIIFTFLMANASKASHFPWNKIQTL